MQSEGLIAHTTLGDLQDERDGGALSLIHDREVSLKVARYYLDVLGVRAREVLQAGHVDALLAAQAQVHKLLPQTVPAASWFDGTLLPASIAAAHPATRRLRWR